MTKSTEEDLSPASSSRPLSSKGLPRLASQDGACWIFGFPWGHPKGWGDKCKPERCSVFSHQKTGKIWSLAPPTKKAYNVYFQLPKNRWRGFGLQGALQKLPYPPETKRRSNLNQKFQFGLDSAVKMDTNPVLFFGFCFVFNSLGFYFVLEIWIIFFSLYTAFDISQRKQYLRILVIYPSAIFFEVQSLCIHVLL